MNIFDNIVLNDLGVTATSTVALILGEALEKLEKIVPKGREAALMITNLQQACMWAKRGVAQDPSMQRKEGV